MARLVLVGLPGTGKTTIADALAALWHCRSIDTDDVLASNVGAPAASYLREHGEAAFRVHELDALRGTLASDAVVATGAGVVTTSAARQLLEGEVTLWLDSDDETLIFRVASGERPLLGDDHASSLARLRRERESWYRECSQARVDTTGTIEDVLERIVHYVSEVST